MITPEQIKKRRVLEKNIDEKLMRDYADAPIEFEIKGVEIDDLMWVVEKYRPHWFVTLNRGHNAEQLIKFSEPESR